MATEEIEISELEFTEELASDNLIPVESSTDTKATSLQILKNWLSSFFVGKTGNEYIAGVKIFGSQIKTSEGILRTTNLDSTSKPQSYQERTVIEAQDKNGVLNTSIRVSQNTAGNVSTAIYAGNKGINKSIGVSVRSDGTAYGYAPTPDSTSNDNHMATTQWIFNNGGSIIAKSLGTNGYIKYSSGLIIQWGHCSGETSPRTITFPTPFSSKDSYSLQIQVLSTIGNVSGNRPIVDDTNTRTGTSAQVISSGDVAKTGWEWLAIGY